jgi:hypothetical protein
MTMTPQKIPAPKLKMVVTEMATGAEMVNDLPMVVAQWRSGSFACVTLFPEEIVPEVCEGLEAAREQVRRMSSGIVLPQNGESPDELAKKLNGLRGDQS